jgi:tRNA 5-methylaminomethyl-2-thiouridine biosynthesis bifunctional protein
LPAGHMQLLDGGALWFPMAGAVDPVAICEALLENVDVRLNTRASKLVKNQGVWSLFDGNSGLLGEFDAVAVASGIGSLEFVNADDFQVNANRGQLSYLEKKDLTIKHPVSFGSYLATTREISVVGATYKKLSDYDDPAWQELDAKDHDSNLRALTKQFPGATFGEIVGGRAGVRATTVDRVPVVGMMPDNPDAWLAFGFGSRGFLTAPLAGAALAAEIVGAASPLPMSLWAALSPERFKQRRIRKQG